MFDYRQELQRRVDQFAGLLKEMHRRAHTEVEGPCFIIFNEKQPDDGAGMPALAESAKPAVELVSAAFDEAGIATVTRTDDSPFAVVPDEGWRQDDTQDRFIQFSFEQHWFCLDMPRQTLYLAEAEHILRCREGFFYLRDRPEFTLYGELVEGFEPFRKIYVYFDEDSAAQDMAFILFQVWRFPIDWRFFVKADAFGKKTSGWENGSPLE